LIKQFLRNRAESVDFIDRLINGTSQLNDTRGNDLFAGRFNFLIAEHMAAGAIYDDILKRMFNNAVSGAEMHVDNLKGVQGELGLRLGEGEYFGVINVGDDRELANLCSDNGFIVSDKDFSESLFKKLSASDSPVKILIGSKKFTEGWNSWRVSTMGLMNVGRSEGSEIIQLFGRGVRLKGFNECLKRSTFANAPRVPRHIGVVETLNVFGVRADYMKQFREYLEEEGVKGKDDCMEIKIPCIRNLGRVKLKYPHLKQGVSFKKDAPRPVFGEPDDYLLSRPIIVNWYPRIEAMRSKGAGIQVVAALHTAKLGPLQCAFLDYEALYFELQRHKNERCYYNLNIEKDALAALLGRSDWYELYIPPEELEFTSFEKVRIWQEIASTLLKKYCDNFYNARRMDYEKDKLEYRYLDEVEAELLANGRPGNLFDEYTFLVEKSRVDIIEKLKELKAQIESGNFADWEFRSTFSFNFDRHLYKPLIHIKDSELKVMPVALNDGENKFIRHLKAYYETHKADFEERELYLLRNLGRGHGIGFFQAQNFYPDFIMWLVQGRKQQIIFIDPHGMRMVQGGFNDPKVRFYRAVKELERHFGDADVALDSFVISVTSFSQIGLWDTRLTQEDFEDHHVLFQDEDGHYIQKIFRNYISNIKIVSDIKRTARFRTHLPLYSLSAACGKFGHGQEVREEGWIDVGTFHQLSEDMFVVRAIGNSMEPKIANGDYCIFRADQGGTRNGKIVLVECLDDLDKDTGKYTIKMYSSMKREEEDVLIQEEIVLKPLNKSFDPIVLPANEEGKLRVVGVFIDVVRAAGGDN